MINLSRVIAKHAREFRAALAANQYERAGDKGVFFPRQKSFINGVYTYNDAETGKLLSSPNLLPTEGLNYILDNFIASHSLITLYLALYAGAISPTSLWTASNFASTASEISSGSEGYTQSNRVAWVPAAATAATKDNYASPAAFTIITATALAVNGAGMLTNATKASTAGALISATRFSAAQSLTNGAIFNLQYQLGETSS